MTKSFITSEISFNDATDAVVWFAMMEMNRVDARGYVGHVCGDKGERIVVVARKSGPLSYTLYERAA